MSRHRHPRHPIETICLCVCPIGLTAGAAIEHINRGAADALFLYIPAALALAACVALLAHKE